MSRRDISHYFTRSFWSRMPLYKAVLALCCAMLLVVGTGAGIAITAVNAAASSAPGSSSGPDALPTPDPTASPTPTPEPTPTPAPVQLALEVTAVQQSLGVTVMEVEKDIPLVGVDFEVIVDYEPGKNADKSGGKTSSSKKEQPATETYELDTETGTLLIEELPVGEYTVSLAEKEGYILPEPVTAQVKEKVEYKVDTEKVKDQIKDESEVGAGDIVTDDKVLDDQTSSDFDPTLTPKPNDYDSNASSKTEVKQKVYLVKGNTKEEGGRQWLLNADGTRSNYYVSKTGTDANSAPFIVEAAYEAPKAAGPLSNMLGGVLRLFFPTAWAAGETDGEQAAGPTASSAEQDGADNAVSSVSTSTSDSTGASTPDGESSSGSASTPDSSTSTSGSTSAPDSGSTSGSTSTPDSGSTSGSASTPDGESTSGSTSAPDSGSTSGSTSTPGSGSSSGSTGTPDSGSQPTPTPTPPATVRLYDAASGALASEMFQLTATEVVTQVLYSGWQPSFEDKQAYYDPGTHEKLVNVEKTIAGVTYRFDASGKPSVANADNGLVKGIDVSKYQGNIDWNAVKASGIEYAIIRVGYRGYGSGALVEDPYFRQNIKGANAAGVKVGLYFYTQAVNEAEAVDEASMVIRLLQETGGRVSYPIYYDTEKVANDTGRADNISRDQRTRNAVAFCNAIQNAGYRAGVYSYASWFYNNLNMANLTGYSVWIAQYRDNLDFNYNWDIWQYTSSGTVPGVPGRVDMNVSKLG